MELKYKNMQRSLCQKHDRKCLTSPLGRCPLSKFNCYDFLSFRDFIGNINERDRKKVRKVLEEAAAAAGYHIDDFTEGTKLL